MTKQRLMVTAAAVMMTLLASPAPVGARQAWLADVRQAVLDALPFPEAVGLRRAPDGDTQSEWVVSPREGDGPGAPVEVVRNRLNPLNEQREAVHENQMSEAREAQRVALRQADPRGLEQLELLEDRWQADGRLRATFGVEPAAPYTVDTADSPFVTPVPGAEAVVVAVRGNAYGLETVSGARRQQTWREAEARVFVGLVSPPAVSRRPGFDQYKVEISSEAPVLIVTLSGNEDLITQVIDTVDWARVAALAPRHIP